MANALDRIVGYFSPAAGRARMYHRELLQRAYEAASPRDKWRPRRAGASANADHLADAARIRAKARALRQNVPYIAAGMEALVDSTVGTGVVVRSTGQEAERVNELFAAWKSVCDADGRLDFDGLIAAAYDAMEQDGEALVRLRPRLAGDGLPVPLQLQLLEIDWLDGTRTGQAGGNRIVNGIEYDALGRVAAYYLFDEHPGDIGLMRTMTTQSRRVPAEFIIHLYRIQRPGQGRGFSRLAPVIVRTRDLQLYEDAELARKNLETRLSVVYSGDASLLANPAAVGEAADTAEARRTGELGQLASGGITELPAGGNLMSVEPKPAGGYTEYVKQQLHLIASGMGVTYEMMTGDVSETNFSSARVRLLDFRRAVQRMQWLTLAPRLLRPIHVAFVDAGILAGKLRARDYAVEYSFPKWDYVNPLQDVQADLAEISGGLASISEKLRQRGYSPDDVFAELAADREKLEALGLQDWLLFKETKKEPGAAGDAAAASSAAAANARAFDALAAVLDRMDTRLAGLEQRTTSVVVNQGDTTVQTPAQTIDIRNEAPAQPAPVVHVAPAAPEVRVVNEIPAQAAPVVTVEAPEVRVINQVEAPVVNVNTPDREEITDVQRDKAGRITRTVKTQRRGGASKP